MYPHIQIIFGWHLDPKDITGDQWRQILTPNYDPEDWWEGIDNPEAPGFRYFHRPWGEGLPDEDLLFFGFEIFNQDCSSGSVECGIDRRPRISNSEGELLAIAAHLGISLEGAAGDYVIRGYR